MTPTYDERRMLLTVCACGRSVSHPTACQDAGTCLMGRRDAQIAAMRQRQQERQAKKSPEIEIECPMVNAVTSINTFFQSAN